MVRNRKRKQESNQASKQTLFYSTTRGQHSRQFAELLDTEESLRDSEEKEELTLGLLSEAGIDRVHYTVSPQLHSTSEPVFPVRPAGVSIARRIFASVRETEKQRSHVSGGNKLDVSHRTSLE